MVRKSKHGEMSRRAFTALMASSLAGCGILTPAYTYRYRLKLSLTIDGSERSAASVLETKWVDTAGWNQGMRWVPKTWGDAFLFPISNNAALIGLLRRMQDLPAGFDDFTILFESLAKGAGRYDANDFGGTLRGIEGINGEYQVPHRLLPYLLYLPDIHNLKSGALISPSAGSPRFSVSEFTIALTQNSISRGIEKLVPCLAELSEQRRDPTFRGDPITLPPYQLLEWRNVIANGEVA